MVDTIIAKDLRLLGNKRSKVQTWLLVHAFNTTPDSCLFYPYAKDGCGYGLVGGYGSGKSKRAHIVVFQAVHGYTPEVVMHSCDNPSCVNPYHLRAGTKATNNADRASKGRSAKTVPSRQRLSSTDVEAIRARWKPGKAPKANPDGTVAIARDYGVDSAVIVKVIKGAYLV